MTKIVQSLKGITIRSTCSHLGIMNNLLTLYDICIKEHMFMKISLRQFMFER